MSDEDTMRQDFEYEIYKQCAKEDEEAMNEPAQATVSAAPEAWPEIESIEFASVEDRKKCEKLLREWNSEPSREAELRELVEKWLKEAKPPYQDTMPLGEATLATSPAQTREKK